MIAVLIICGIGVMENGNGHKSGKGAGDYKKETVESGVKKWMRQQKDRVPLVRCRHMRRNILIFGRTDFVIIKRQQ